MSVDAVAAELEGLVASRVGKVGVGGPFTVQSLESYVSKIAQHDEMVTFRLERQQIDLLARKRKPPILTCPNPLCQNQLDENFEKDERMAQLTCILCGVEVLGRMVFDGEWERLFEGEVNPTSHGPKSDDRFSSAHNLGTNIVSLPGGLLSSQAKDLSSTQQEIEMNYNNGTKRTRQAYKDKMKTEMFQVIQDVGESVQLHRMVLERAKTLFARLRDDTEQLNNRYEHVAACIILALREKRNAVTVSPRPDQAVHAPGSLLLHSSTPASESSQSDPVAHACEQEPNKRTHLAALDL